MEILNRINELRNKRGWSIYKLAEESGITQSTLANMFSRQTLPSLTTLKQLCDAFGITMAQFFQGDSNEFNDEEQLIISNYRKLEKQEKEVIKKLLESILSEK
ncbi:MAG: helix-turn-helix transcriptional regulator [Clostridiales bacterium]|nr:helix-turn-helix transcriptional regulator [Clostridiales bacterium]